jgi:hypothetical protein
VVKRIVNHISGSFAGVVRVYQMHQCDDKNVRCRKSGATTSPRLAAGQDKDGRTSSPPIADSFL